MTKSLRERFIEKTETDPATGCQLWQGATSGRYGVICVNGVTRSASHIAVELATGTAPPPKAWVRPTCGRKDCVAAAHLKVEAPSGRGVKRKTKPIADRLAAKVKPDPHSECLLWHGATNLDGRGCIGLDGGSVAVHRVAYSLHSGEPIPAGMIVRHRCDTPLCVNPDHLELGTAEDNRQDRRDRGRTARGRNFFPQLTAEGRATMLAAKEAGWSLRSIVDGWALSPSTVQAALKKARTERDAAR